jgi:hypothetical protein
MTYERYDQDPMRSHRFRYGTKDNFCFLRRSALDMSDCAARKGERHHTRMCAVCHSVLVRPGPPRSAPCRAAARLVTGLSVVCDSNRSGTAPAIAMLGIAVDQRLSRAVDRAQAWAP